MVWLGYKHVPEVATSIIGVLFILGALHYLKFHMGVEFKVACYAFAGLVLFNPIFGINWRLSISSLLKLLPILVIY
ncbi:hypothetical protein AND4_00643 [Vibrio sp. AND4]|nr:hypothetical protein AND4_00643 [Vibrio sp. AND4]